MMRDLAPANETPTKRSRVAASTPRPITPRPGSTRIQQQRNKAMRPLNSSGISAIGGMVSIAPSPHGGVAWNKAGISGSGRIVPDSGDVHITSSPCINFNNNNGARSGSPANGKCHINGAKVEKGLRQFSAMVCAKVEEKGITSYNEVADELVQEMGMESSTGERFDHKNIRRRVYDALNVLMAIEIIQKDKKEIKWLGLPNDFSSDLRMVENEKMATEKRIAEKRKCLNELLRRLVCLKFLVSRNKRLEAFPNPSNGNRGGLKADFGGNGNNLIGLNTSEKLPLPFILINAPKDCRVHCEMLEDRSQYFFQFDSSFFINEDVEILKLMGMDSSTPEELSHWMPMDLLGFWSDGKVSVENYGTLLASTRSSSRIAVKTMHHSGLAGRPTAPHYHPQSSPTTKRHSSLYIAHSTHLNLMNPPIKRLNSSNNLSSSLGIADFMSDLGYVTPSKDANYPINSQNGPKNTFLSNSNSLGSNLANTGTKKQHPLAALTSLGSSPII